MKKRIVLLLSILVLATLILGWVNLAEAQQAGKVYRIGVLITASPGFWSEPFLDGFRQGLREIGYVEGKNVVLEIRFGESKRDRVANLAAELVRLKVDVIVAGGTLAINAAKKATRVIPIVMRTGRDPVRSGYVDS